MAQGQAMPGSLQDTAPLPQTLEVGYTSRGLIHMIVQMMLQGNQVKDNRIEFSVGSGYTT